MTAFVTSSTVLIQQNRIGGEGVKALGLVGDTRGVKRLGWLGVMSALDSRRAGEGRIRGWQSKEAGTARQET